MLNTLGILMLIFGGVLILGSLVLMVVWRVPSLVDEISGKKAKRLIQRMKNANVEVSGRISGQVPVASLPVPTVDVVTSSSPEVVGSGTGSALNMLVNDPYGTIGKKKVRAEGVQKPVSVPSQNTMVVVTPSVVIIEEQSSI